MSKLHFNKFTSLEGSILLKGYSRTFDIASVSDYSLLMDAYTFCSDYLDLAEGFLDLIQNFNTSIHITKLCRESVKIVNSSKTERIDDFIRRFNLKTSPHESLLCSLLNDSDSNFLILPVRGSIYAEIIRNAMNREGKTYILYAFNTAERSYSVFDVSSYVNDWKKGEAKIGLSTDQKYDMPAPRQGEVFYILEKNGNFLDQFSYNAGRHFGAEASVQHLTTNIFQKDVTAKIFTRQRTENEMGKLNLMLKRSLSSIDGLEAWPIKVICDQDRAVRGFVMEKIPGNHINRLNQGADAFRALFKGKTKADLIRLCLDIVKTDIQSAIRSFHLVDNNFQNIFLDQNFKFHYIDLDSAQISLYPSEVISCESHNYLYTIMPDDMKTELDVPFVSVRVSSYITALIIWKLLSFATSPYVRKDNQWVYWGELSIDEQLEKNELLAVAYSWFPPSLRFAFYMNFHPIRKNAISSTNIYMALEDFAKELQSTTNAEAGFIVPETLNDLNPENQAWEQEFRSLINNVSTPIAGRNPQNSIQDTTDENIKKTTMTKSNIQGTNYNQTQGTKVISPQYNQNTLNDKKEYKNKPGSTKESHSISSSHDPRNEESSSKPQNMEKTVKDKTTRNDTSKKQPFSSQGNKKMVQKDMQSFLKSLLIKGLILIAIIVSIIIYFYMEW